MSLPKFVSLLQTSQLYLSRLDLLNDLHEGSLPRALVEARKAFLEGEGIAHLSSLFSSGNQKVREACYVNCWALSDFESEAFWRLYSRNDDSRNDDGVAVQSTYQKLVDIIKGDDELYVGRVSYLDYETQWFPDGNLYYPVMHKRLAFAHEREVRLVKLLYAHVVEGSPPGPPGLHVPVDLERLVEGIFVTPYAQDWYVDVVRAVVERFAPPLGRKVQWSQMKSAPLY